MGRLRTLESHPRARHLSQESRVVHPLTKDIASTHTVNLHVWLVKSRSVVIIPAHSRCVRGRLPHASTSKPVTLALDVEAGIPSWTPDPWLSPWYSLELHVKIGNGFTNCPISRRLSFPRSRLITSTLEALAVFIGLKLFFGERPQPHRTKILVKPTWTDKTTGAGQRSTSLCQHGSLLQRYSGNWPASQAHVYPSGHQERPTGKRIGEAAEKAVRVRAERERPARERKNKRRRPEDRMLVTHPW